MRWLSFLVLGVVVLGAGCVNFQRMEERKRLSHLRLHMEPTKQEAYEEPELKERAGVTLSLGGLFGVEVAGKSSTRALKEERLRLAKALEGGFSVFAEKDLEWAIRREMHRRVFDGFGIGKAEESDLKRFELEVKAFGLEEIETADASPALFRFRIKIAITPQLKPFEQAWVMQVTLGGSSETLGTLSAFFEDEKLRETAMEEAIAETAMHLRRYFLLRAGIKEMGEKEGGR